MASRASTAPDYDADMDAVWERLGVNAECSDLNGPHRLLEKGCEARGLDFRGDHPQHRPRHLRPGHGRLHGLRRPVRLEALDREDLPRRRRRARGRLPRPLPGRADHRRERPRRRRRGDLPRSRRRGTAGGHRAGADRGRRLRLDRVAGAAAAQRDRRPRRRRQPAPAPDERRLRLPRGAAGPVVGAAAGRPLPRVRGPRGRLRLPDRVRAAHDRPDRRGAALAFRPRPQGGDGQVTRAAPASSTSPAIAATAG